MRMRGADDPVLLEIDSNAAATAYRGFEAWAGSEFVKVFFAPDTMMAVDQPGRRGFLYDEVYFISVWASVGGEALLETLHAIIDATDGTAMVIKAVSEEPRPEQMLALALEHGAPIDEVRHLI